MLLTGSFQDTKSATEFYDAKVKELGANIQNLESIVQGKTNNLRVVEEGTTTFPHFLGPTAYRRHCSVTNKSFDLVLRQKVLAQGAGPASAQA